MTKEKIEQKIKELEADMAERYARGYGYSGTGIPERINILKKRLENGVFDAVDSN